MCDQTNKAFQHPGDAAFVDRIVELLRDNGHGACAHTELLAAAAAVAGRHGMGELLGALLSAYGQLIAEIWRSAPETKDFLDPTGPVSALIVALAEKKNALPVQLH